MKKAFILIITLIMAIAVFSCNDDPYKSVDSSKIIGQKIDWNNLPYQTGEDNLLYGFKYINGECYNCNTAKYKNKIIAYLYSEDGIITEYFFSKSIRISRAEKVPKGTSYEEVVKIFGEPVFLEYPRFINARNGQEIRRKSFFCEYYLKKFDKFSLKYELDQNMVKFNFDDKGKLDNVHQQYEWRP